MLNLPAEGFDLTADILVHVGLHKTGSTWLQKRFFSNPTAGFALPWGAQSALAFEHLALIDDLEFSKKKASELLSGAARNAGQGYPVLTHEAFSSRPALGEYYSSTAAARIKAVFPNARILLVIREQKQMLYSLYQQSVRDGGRDTLREFIGTGDEPDGFLPRCQLGFFAYDRLIAMYHKLFGADRTLVLPLELLATDEAAFASRINAFVGIEGRHQPPNQPANTSLDPAMIGLLRMSNGFFRPGVGKRGFKLTRRLADAMSRRMPQCLSNGWKTRMQQNIKDRVGDRYAESNERLAALIEMDLAVFGYDLPSRPD